MKFSHSVLLTSSKLAIIDGASSFVQDTSAGRGLHGGSSIPDIARAAKVLTGRTSSPPSHIRRKCRRRTSSFAIPGVSSLAPSHGIESAMIFPQSLSATVSATLTYLSLVVYFDRPRGSLTIPDPQSALSVRPSRVPNAGLGLFAARPLPEGTLLGTYPGVLRPAQAFYDGKCRAHPRAVGYSWRFADGEYVIDPTDRAGEMRDVCLGGSAEVPLSEAIFGTLLSFWGADTRLCRINEPPIGAGGCNVSARENLEKREVMLELVQDVVAGQELYLDYGLDYDRSGYGPS